MKNTEQNAVVERWVEAHYIGEDDVALPVINELLASKVFLLAAICYKLKENNIKFEDGFDENVITIWEDVFAGLAPEPVSIILCKELPFIIRYEDGMEFKIHCAKDFQEFLDNWGEDLLKNELA